MAAKTLKSKNQPQVVTFIVASAVLLGVVLLGASKVVLFAQSVSKGHWESLAKFLALPAVLSLLAGLVGWAVPRNIKEVLVFWKLGKFRLPSCRAFTDLGPADPRVNMARLALRVGPLPSTPSEQTALWYRLYRSHGDEASVEDAHGAYLKFRELTHLSVALSVVSIVVAVVLHVPARRIGASIAVSAIEYLLAVAAARNTSDHLVVNVLALESSAVDQQHLVNFVGKFDGSDQTASQTISTSKS